MDISNEPVVHRLSLLRRLDLGRIGRSLFLLWLIVINILYFMQFRNLLLLRWAAFLRLWR